MSNIITIHSFKRGTGKSTLTANIAALFALQGLRVGVIDAHLRSPSLHFLFGLHEHSITHWLNDYLSGRCDVEQTALDVTVRLGAPVNGRVFLVPARPIPCLRAEELSDRYDTYTLSSGCHSLIESLDLDIVLIDSPTIMTEETLSWIAVADTLTMIMRLDQQDYQGTSVVIEIAQHLGMQHITLVVNQSPSDLHPAQVKEHLEQIYRCDVGAVLSHCDELMAVSGTAIFVARHQDHPFTAALNGFVTHLIEHRLINAQSPISA
jgi:MinD-like ATPase involved in chromosome partitioning or flagellar assembly